MEANIDNSTTVEVNGVYLGYLSVDNVIVVLALPKRGHLLQKLFPFLNLIQNLDTNTSNFIEWTSSSTQLNSLDILIVYASLVAD